MGLRLSEGLALKVGDIDAVRHRVHIRDSKGNRIKWYSNVINGSQAMNQASLLSASAQQNLCSTNK